ncbi:hypothetical protein GLOIN_2v1565934 [Rhizophagus irregularis DAOM 181602=DAOM 197198]|uniref:Uncharacterized protein n=1 Tax=Rhizophagus irregularis (strain DAOM 181602 / DAOM 197198 / MUCL 43194) TaxID=747089 RepID=A0A2P4QCL1_RHIID|nr:hypothetical protein GLOIN_2v1565934 [Rhizophagus irregularis DAOM 181602=DAOM 197198]POG75359.1 hypothetical protein GLOIN_2v1565934 [Rhizophagus irregularis DAOM 181602=DAOM 197198]|eukprot:XP_025182225.1 hypothetical protein GLOIN_2v1565934 [Rhizophagus irregularis DAOM 181602=DAOM 197198]
MSSELEVLKQRITELEFKNVKLEAENAELRKENTEISYLRNKLSVSDAEIVELKRRNAEFLRANKEYNKRRDADNAKLRAENAEFRDKLTKVEQKQTLQSTLTANDNSSNISSSNFNLVTNQVPTVTHHEKPLVDTSLPEDKETDAFLDEKYKKKVSNEIRQKNREKKLCFSTFGQTQESLPTHPEEKMSQVLNSVTQPCNSTSSEEKICSELDSKCKKGKKPSIEQNHVTEISETLCPGKVTSDKSSIDEASQYLAQLCDKAFDAEDKANRANQEEILYCNGGKFDEKKARGLLYDSITKQLNLLRKQRSQETGLQLRGVSQNSLRKKTQRAKKVYKFIEQVGLDKIKYIKSYSATSISELTNEQIQDVINYGISSEKLPLVTDHVTEISETLCPRKNLPVNTPDQNNVLEVLFPKESTAHIPLAHDSVPKRPSNSSDNSKEEAWFDEDMFFNEANPTKVNTVTSDDDVYFGKANKVNKHDGDPNSINDDSDSDSNSEDEIPDDSDDDGYGGYGGYNEYGECDRGYYYRDEGYERKTSPMMSPIISPVTA